MEPGTYVYSALHVLQTCNVAKGDAALLVLGQEMRDVLRGRLERFRGVREWHQLGEGSCARLDPPLQHKDFFQRRARTPFFFGRHFAALDTTEELGGSRLARHDLLSVD